MMKRIFHSGLITITVFLFARGSLLTQERFNVREHYVKSEHMIAMRDGIRLFANVYSPKDTSQRYPFMIHRTPYGSPPYGPDAYRAALGPSADFGREGYIFVYQDVRGQYKSEGEFVVMRPIRPDHGAPSVTDESTDTYDTIDWLLKNIPNNNGRAGEWGVSYPGSQTVWALVDQHPALKAASPQAPAIDMFLGDDFHHNGAFRLMYTFGWLSGSARVRSGPSETRGLPFDYGTQDGYRFFLNAGGVGSINDKYFENRVPTWNEYMQHPDYDDYWKRQNPLKHLKNITAAVLNVAGWFDAEDFYGPLETYSSIESQNPSNKNTLVVGPWLHGGWGAMPGDSLGAIQFESKTGEYFRQNVELPFFNFYLKDKGEFKLPEALVFETGANQWRSYDRWPPPNTEQKTLYFHPKRKLSFTPPSEASMDASDSFDSDPSKPVPWSMDRRTTQGQLWMVEDQRFATTRPDVLVYETEPLTSDVTIAGPVIASLTFSTTGTDADWIVKLIDVYPPAPSGNASRQNDLIMGEYQMLLVGEVFRSKYRNSYSKPEPLVPGQPTRLEFNLRDKFHRFLRGHRIMAQVQSTWFPVIDRNPQQFMNIYQARESDFKKATHTVYRSAKMPSGVKVNVLK